MADVTTKGFIIGKCLQLAREKLNDQEFAALESELGVELRKLKTAFFVDYPVALQIAVEERVCKIVWNESYETGVYKIGRLNFTSFSESTFGRATLAMMGKDPKTLLRATVRLISAVTGGMVIEVKERGEKEFSLRLRNAPHRPLGWKGIIDAALERTGIAPEVRIVNHGPNDNEFVVTWN